MIFYSLQREEKEGVSKYKISERQKKIKSEKKIEREMKVRHAHMLMMACLIN